MCCKCNQCIVQKIINCPCFLDFINQLISNNPTPLTIDIDLNNIALGDGNGSLIDSNVQISTDYSIQNASDNKVLTEKAVREMIYSIINAHT